MNNPLASWDILARLRLKHIGLSIDDFGTGHSSLAQLRDVPFDELKIDRSFVHGAASNRSQRAILEASLAMARELGLKTVAEGVEDREDWEYLRKAGCDMVQGYFIAKPMPPENLGDCLARCEMLKPTSG
jgi:EAL domain-containing protein (putative c-di-GMP-specific phosphodiesterase class I)